MSLVRALDHPDMLLADSLKSRSNVIREDTLSAALFRSSLALSMHLSLESVKASCGTYCSATFTAEGVE